MIKRRNILGIGISVALLCLPILARGQPGPTATATPTATPTPPYPAVTHLEAGQTLIGTGPATDPAAAYLTAGQGIDITSGPGSIEISAPSGGGGTGAAGPTGPTGATGPQGPSGASGVPGIAGPTGAQGNTGAQGSNGLPGAAGPSGATGPEGPSGLQGPSGPSGTNGSNGAVGATGAAGATGPSGAQGSTGLTGATGPTGSTGPVLANSMGTSLETAAATAYFAIGTTMAPQASATYIEMPWPYGETFTKIYCYFTAAQGASKSDAMSLIDVTNTCATALTCTATNATRCSSTSGSCVVSAGDLLVMKDVTTGSSITARNGACSFGP